SHLLHQRCDLPLQLRNSPILGSKLLILGGQRGFQLRDSLISPVLFHVSFLPQIGADGKLHEIMEQLRSLTLPPRGQVPRSATPVNGYSFRSKPPSGEACRDLSEERWRSTCAVGDWSTAASDSAVSSAVTKS